MIFSRKEDEALNNVDTINELEKLQEQKEEEKLIGETDPSKKLLCFISGKSIIEIAKSIKDANQAFDSDIVEKLKNAGYDPGYVRAVYNSLS